MQSRTEVVLWQCYGDAGTGTALVMGLTRSEAVLVCRYWLGWSDVTAWRAQEYLPLFQRAGGTPSRPVVYSENNLDWAVITEPAKPSEVSENISR